MLAAPSVVRAQTKEIFVGGPASPGLTDVLFPLIERKHGFKILFEGSNSLVNLEKIRANKARPTMTVTMMDDPVLILAEREKVITPLKGLNISNLADVRADSKPREAMWANWCQPAASIAYNTDSVTPGPTSYAEVWDKKYRDKVILISMRITQAVVPLLAAAQLATGKPLAECLQVADAGFEKLKELKPNILQVTSNAPQAQQLLETGEIDHFLSPDTRTVLFRKAQGAPVDQAQPKEGSIAMPAGVALVANGPNPELGMAFINELLDPETQALIAKTFYSNPTNTKTVKPAGLDLPELVVLDWEYFTDNRNRWIERFEREISGT
ncbi:extracellular solute-binding protein [Teichococcus vastitatis]|uniref:Extracellular solute-binding protein n=1 Tax=Teichococcus vastitatis TaxID=2307076 RepID=A0ABS9W9Q7_9PROT|nr:extracellular solute-binding protein [Pseudoroseomonas vastitatis]MCI0755723.1 extracellular solute-binding protein [Pseudoroseomonas vastitatis]